MNVAVHWFRRDFRMRDNTGLFAAADAHDAVVGVCVIDPRWFGNRERMGPFQVKFWLESLRELRIALAARGIPLVIRQSADPVAAVLAVAREASAEAITYNKEYEPQQIAQDCRLQRTAAAAGVKLIAFKDACIIEENEVLTGAGAPYSVFTPYKNAYLKKLVAQPPGISGLPRRPTRSLKVRLGAIPTARDLGYEDVSLDPRPGERSGARQLAHFAKTGLKHYARRRDFPALPGTSRLSAHLSAGTVSIRQAIIAAAAAAVGWKRAAASTFITELIWREFYRMILFHFPHTVSRPFHARYAGLQWTNNPTLLAAWQTGRTGYPIVDAAMRQLAATGFMHNRLRMIAAMFLTKDLDCHWSLGERFFMRSLIDYDQASNVGGWQWSASTGTDAAPYFRVMNPVLQSQRWDADGAFIRHWLPELAKVPSDFLHSPWQMPDEVQRAAGCIIGRDYPPPVVDHAAAKRLAVQKFRRK